MYCITCAGRSQAAVCSNRGLLYVFGGTDSWNCYNTVEVYDRQKNVWRFVASMSQARRGAAAVNYRGQHTIYYWIPVVVKIHI